MVLLVAARSAFGYVVKSCDPCFLKRVPDSPPPSAKSTELPFDHAPDVTGTLLVEQAFTPSLLGENK
jgi:hypothetical protein